MFMGCASEANKKFTDRVAFTPSFECENMIIELINSSIDTIDVAVYSINNDNIVEALQNAYKRGVKIRILTDKVQASNKHSKAFDLYKSGLDIKVNSKHKIEHNKFGVFDGKYVVTGSYNWTNAATSKNSENCYLIASDKTSIVGYKKRYDYLWNVNNKEKSKNWFMKKLQYL